MKKILIGVLIFIGLGTISSQSNSSKTVEDKSNTKVESTIQQEESETINTGTTDTNESEKMEKSEANTMQSSGESTKISDKTFENAIMNILEESFKGSRVRLESEEMVSMFIITAPTGTMLGLSTGDAAVKKEWNNVVSTFKDLSKSMSKQGRDSGYNKAISLSIANELNEENLILTIMDGIVIYNVADEF